jgi:hypothetical protein
MRIRLAIATAVSVLAAVAVAAAPTTAAAPAPKPRLCGSSGAGSMCQSPGNVRIDVPRRALTHYQDVYLPYLPGGH